MYKIVESVGNKIQQVSCYDDLEKHHPSSGKEKGREYATVDGKLEEVRNTNTRVLIKKDFVLLVNGSNKNVKVPSPVSGIVKTNRSYGTVSIYSNEKLDDLVGQVLHLDPNFIVKDGQYVKYGDIIGIQSGTPKNDKSSPYAIHVHAELEKEQFKKYIHDLLVGSFSSKGTGSENKKSNGLNFPIVKESGEQYQTAEDVYKLLEKETSGFYLLSAHNFWHGGLHFTDASVSHHVNKQAIRCMMDGKVVAYRLNKDYLTSNWAGNTLQFSSSFCLVQHDYESPANSDEGSNKGKKNKLTFYSLYMHLAPYSVYANKDSQVAKKDQKNKLKIKQTIRVRKGEAATQSAPPVLGHLGIGSIVDLTGETAQFSVQEQSGSHSYRFVKGSVSEVQGKTDATVTKGAVIWVVDDSKYTEHVTPSSATPSEMKPPAYWQCKMKGIVKNRVNARAIKDNSKAFSEKNSEALGLLNITAEFEFETKEILTCQIGGKSHQIAKATLIKGGYADKAGQPPSPFWVCIDEPFVTLEAQPPTQFDEVIKLNNPIPIKAGDAIGYMGLYEVPKMPAASGLKTSKHQVHIEIFTTESDANVKAFLDNQAGLKSGKQYLKVKKDTCIYVRNEDKKKISFATAGLKTSEDTVFELDVCKKEKDSNNAVYYKINQLPVPLNHKQDGYIGEKEAEILSQYDLSKLGFLMLEEKHTNSDGYLDPEKMPDFFQQLYKEIDTDGKNGVDSTEIAAAFRDKSKRDKLVKLVAKHPSEWHSLTINTIKQTLSSWREDNLEKETEELLEHEKTRMEKLEWMSKLFSPMVWHFNSVEIIAFLMRSFSSKNWAHSKFGNKLALLESNDDYSAYNRTLGARSFYNTNITSLSIAEIQNKQANREIFAAGRYQVVPSTLQLAIKELNIKSTDIFSPELQDRIFNEYLIKIKRPNIIKFLEGDGNVEDAIYDWAKEFASAGVRKGKRISPVFKKKKNGDYEVDANGRKIKIERCADVEGWSYYHGDGLNEAHILPNEMVDVLTESKNGGN